ncbi:TolC family protein [Candidatus Poribacteria bacterium]|nr:TolC family protein [Candidatus Poribacteria bacterium]MYA58725.1 TolC family protein [Candidatus Poribacteria bacterium]
MGKIGEAHRDAAIYNTVLAKRMGCQNFLLESVKTDIRRPPGSTPTNVETDKETLMIHGKVMFIVLSKFKETHRSGFRSLLLKFILAVQFAVVFSLSAQGPATEVDLTQALTLEQCIQVGLEKSTSMRNARLNLAIQELRVNTARADYFPRIFSTGAYDFSDRIDFGFEPENYNLGLGAQYTIWDNGQREGGFAQAKESLNATVSRNEGIKQSLILQITEAYYDVLQYQALVEVSEQNLARAQENTQRTKDFVEAGSLIPADIATAEVREGNNRLTLLNNQNLLQVAKARLPRLLGLDPGVLITVAADESYRLYQQRGTIERIEIPVEEAIQIALDNRPEFKETESQLRSQEWALTLAKLQRWPRLNADVDYNVNLDDYLRERENFSDFRSWSAGVSLNFTFFDGGILGNRVKELAMQLEQTRENASDLERSVALDVRQTYLNLKRSEAAVDISKTQVVNARLSLDVIQGRFDVDKAILLELLDAQTSYAQALTDEVNTFYDYKITQTRLQDAMGVLQ